MPDFEDPITVCGDCVWGAKGTVRTTHVDGEETCEWCGETLDGQVKIVENQEDPGRVDWQIIRDGLIEWLEDREYICDIRVRKRTVDFTIGRMEDWPRYTEDDHVNAIRSSSVSMSLIVEDGMFSEAKIHLPPAPEGLKDDIEASLDLPDGFGVHYGTGALGGIPAPDGIVTPHVLLADEVDADGIREAVSEVLQVYVDVYDEGEKVILSMSEVGDDG